MQESVLIIEDEIPIADFVQTALRQAGFTTYLATTGSEALAQLEHFQPDLIILDLMLPDIDGLEVCQAIRVREHYIPIIMLTARAEDVDRIVGLELGADDYITKPFQVRELIARVRAVLRLVRSCTGRRPGEMLRFGELEINLTGREVCLHGRRIELTPKEFDLLALLARNPGRVLGRDTILEKVWGYDFVGDSRTVDVHVQRLRRKLGDDPHHPRYILTVRSIGYKFAKT